MKNCIKLSVLVLVVVFVAGCMGQGHVRPADPPAIAPVQESLRPAPAPPAVEAKAGPSWVVDGRGFRTRAMDLDVREGLPYTPVGAEIESRVAPVRLIEVVQQLAQLHGFSVSWSDDVDPDTMVNVNIRPEDNLWEALQNLLRQRDYFFELIGETIIIGYKETHQYQVVMPALKETFDSSLSRNEIKIQANYREPLDFWGSLQANLDRILNITAAQDKGHFMIDTHIGLITLTAPRKTHERVSAYLDTLKEQIHRQVVIEAQIMEVMLSDEHRMGINWSQILNTANRIGQQTLGGQVVFGQEDYTLGTGAIVPNVIYPRQDGKTFKFLNYITLTPQAFSIALDLLKDYGTTNVLSNPKITLMNGHGATISVGEHIRYVERVTVTEEDDGRRTYSPQPGSLHTGLGLSVIANVVDDREVVLYVRPSTSELRPGPAGEEIEYISYADGTQIGLPRERIREMSTMARIMDGETLIIGGHIDRVEGDRTNAVPFLGDIPGLGWLFKHEAKQVTSRELVIFITPRIVAAGR